MRRREREPGRGHQRNPNSVKIRNGTKQSLEPGDILSPTESWRAQYSSPAHVTQQADGCQDVGTSLVSGRMQTVGRPSVQSSSLDQWHARQTPH